MANFSLQNERLLKVALNNEKVLSRAGAMVAYDGQIKAICSEFLPLSANACAAVEKR